MLTPELLQEINNGLDFDGFMEQWHRKDSLPMKGLDAISRRYRFYSRYNLERQARVDTLWNPSEAFTSAVQHAPGPSTWMVITDDWCIDSAYSMPLLKWATDQRSDITLKILLKDDHPELHDQFLRFDRRAIPTWAGISEQGEVQFVWGPQPEAIRLIRKILIDCGAEGSLVSATTVDWYADNGWLEVEKEMTEVLMSL
ncbi:MAG: thioredoxin family protein [Bacteroidota bacterium]|nr:thioredoxin family protein [Bacteroidota bacterium]